MRRYLALSVLFLTAPSVASAATLTTTPSGTGVACTEANPCALGQAFTFAVDGDTIAIGTGLYGAAGNLTDGGKDLTISGVTGERRPTLIGTTLALTGEDSTVQDVRLLPDVGTALSLANGAAADRILAQTGNGDGCHVLIGGTLENSVCVGTADGLEAGGTGVRDIRNVTAKGATGGRFAAAGTTTVSNSILVGTGSSDALFDDGITTLTNVNFDPSDPDDDAFTATGTQTDEPIFLDTNDFRQDDLSPTINNGANAQAPAAAHDLNGNLRLLDGDIDIGAFEDVSLAPELDDVSPGSLGPHSATIGGVVNSHGGGTQATVGYGVGNTTDDTARSFLLGAEGTDTAVVSLRDLESKTTYSYVLTIGTDAGTKTSSAMQFTTPSALSATVDSTTDVTANSATINGSYDTDAPGNARFRITPSGGGDPIDTGSTGASGPGTTSATVDGLLPDATYEVVLVVETFDGNIESDPVAFTTLPEAPGATAGDATNVTATSATLNGTADLKQATTGKARFILAGAEQAEQDTTGGAVAQVVTGLTPSTTYEYKLRVQTAGGTVESAAKSFTTAAAPPAASPSPSASPAPSASPVPSASPSPQPSAACTKAKAALTKAKTTARKAAKAVKKAKTAKKKKAAKNASRKAKARVKKARATVRSAC